MVIIIMGVSGSGKTTIGKQLATQLNVPFFDADDFHPQANIEKMGNNIPLTDDDRTPWLQALSNKIKELGTSGGGILACSALKEVYRKMLVSEMDTVFWVYLFGSYELINERMVKRSNHYMKPALLQSQFDIVEAPNYGLHINIEKPIDAIITEIKFKIKKDA